MLTPKKFESIKLLGPQNLFPKKFGLTNFGSKIGPENLG